MLNILLIVDSNNIDIEYITKNYTKGINYYIHSINTSSESLLNNIKYKDLVEKYTIKSIDSTKYNKIAEKEAREYYLELIKDLPSKKILNNKSLNEIFTNNNRNYWWYLPFSEKNIWCDKVIHRIYEIKRIKYLLKGRKYLKINCSLKDNILYDLIQQTACLYDISIVNNNNYKIQSNKWIQTLIFPIKYCINLFKITINILLKKILIFKIKNSYNTKSVNNGIGMFSYFPLFWKDLNTDQSTNIYFNRLQYEIKDKFKVTHIIWLTQISKLFNNSKWLHDLNDSNNVCILEKALRVWDVLSILNIRFILILVSLMINRDNIKFGSVDGINLNYVILDELYRSLISNTFIEAIIIDKAIQKISFKSINMLLYRLEFQPHEKALLYNTANKVTTVGYQHSALSKNFLNYVFAHDELRIHWENRCDYTRMPLPDYIFTSGKVGREYMCNAGYPLSNINIVGGVRFADIYNYKKHNKDINILRNKYNYSANKINIFAPTSLLIIETINMLDALIYSLKDRQDKYFLIFKCHPASNQNYFISEIDQYLVNKWDSANYCYIPQLNNIYDYILMSDISIFLGGSMAIEALMLGVNPLVYFSNSNFSHNPLVEYLEHIRYAFD